MIWILHLSHNLVTHQKSIRLFHTFWQVYSDINRSFGIYYQIYFIKYQLHHLNLFKCEKWPMVIEFYMPSLEKCSLELVYLSPMSQVPKRFSQARLHFQITFKNLLRLHPNTQTPGAGRRAQACYLGKALQTILCNWELQREITVDSCTTWVHLYVYGFFFLIVL